MLDGSFNIESKVRFIFMNFSLLHTFLSGLLTMLTLNLVLFATVAVMSLSPR